MKNYKIIVTIDAFTIGGAQKVIQLLIPEWIKQGHDVSLLLLQNNATEISIESLEKLGVKIHRINAKNMFDIFSFIKFAIIVQRYKPTFIHAHLYWSQIWSTLLKFILPATKIIWIEHNTYQKRTKAKWFVYRKLSLFIDRIFAVSYEVRNFLMGKTSAPVTVVFNPISTKFKPGEKKLNIPSFLFVARLVDQKNPILAIEAFSYALINNLIPQTSILTIVGDGPLMSEIQEAIAISGVEESFRVMGYLNENQLSSIFKNSNTLISTSLHEGSPLVRLEALASGCTVVTTRTGGSRGILTQTENDDRPIDGVFFINNDKRLISMALSKSLEESLWKKESINQRVKKSKLYSPENIAKNYFVNFKSTDFMDE